MSDGGDFLGDGADWRERLEFIVETMREMSRHVDPHEMVAAYSRRMQVVNFDRLLSISRRGVEAPEFILARDSSWEHQPNTWRERGALPRLRGGLLGELAYGDEVRLIQSLEVDPDDPHADLLAGYGSLLAIPVFDDGEGKNVAVFLRRERNAYDPESVPRLVWTTNLFGRATHNLVVSAQLDRELEQVADVQRALLPPSLPEIPTLDLAVSYRPAKRAGGDYYDVIPMGGGCWGIVIADVSGHGSPAAVQMAITRTLIHVYAGGPSPGALLAYVNERFQSNSTGPVAFVTAFCAVYDENEKTLTYANAGHHPPRVKRCSDGTYFQLDSVGGPPVGVVPGMRFEDARVQLRAGDQLLFFTDGLTEAFGPGQEMFGAERVDKIVAMCGDDAGMLLKLIERALADFTGGRELADDVTLLAAKVK